MPLVLIIIGVFFIYYSIKLDKKDTYIDIENIQNNKNQFANYYAENELIVFKKDINEIKEEISYINESILALNLKIEDIENNYNNILNLIEQKGTIKTREINKKLEVKSDNLNNNIKELYDKGLSIDEISSTLRIGKGEVLLRLGLKK
ncbi:MAG: hypothetical protein N2Z71_08950 [Caloramator sp.]|nr:hypothetical protein [Caloramator sp.]